MQRLAIHLTDLYTSLAISTSQSLFRPSVRGICLFLLLGISGVVPSQTVSTDKATGIADSASTLSKPPKFAMVTEMPWVPADQTGSEFPSPGNERDQKRYDSEMLSTDNGLDSAEPQPWIEDRIVRGDTFSEICQRNGIPYQQAYRIASLAGAEILHRILPGHAIRFKMYSQKRLDVLQYELDTLKTLEIRLDEESGLYFATTLIHSPDIRIRKFRGTIHSNLMETSRSAGIPDKIIQDFISVFQWKADFYRDIQSGDRFSVIYEELYLDGERVGSGNLIAAEFNLSGKAIRAIRFTDPDGHTDYYTPNGESFKNGFIRSPVKYATITSHFSKRRLHPITKNWKAHRGVDYGAPEGTPVMATGKGRITTAGTLSGYGITVIIQHGFQYETLYAHLSRIAEGVKPGSSVDQGQIIGYVGSTGLSTGPHLHYEFRVDGIHRDAVTVTLPNPRKIEERHWPEFRKAASNWNRELSGLDTVALARNNFRS